MKTLKTFATLFCFGMLLSLYSPNARADMWDKKTIVTFSGPVVVSGTRLEAGTYVFKLLDSAADRHIVQVFNQDETHLITTVLALPNYRITPTDKTTIKFSENAGDVSTVSRDLPDSGIPIKEWFYPGDNFGQEFLVKPAPVEVAQNTTPTDTTPPVTAEITPAAAAPVTEAPAVTPEPAPAEPAPAAQAPTPAPVEYTAPAELPQTASPMPLIALFGLASLVIAVSLRHISSKTA